MDARAPDAGHDAGRDPRTCSPCRAMTYDECMADSRCEAVPFWGEEVSAVCTIRDDRGFSRLGCPVFVGCRARGVSMDCVSEETFNSTCATICDPIRASVDPLGCRPCSPCSPNEFAIIDDIERCAVEGLCAENPTAAACVDGGTSDAGSVGADTGVADADIPLDAAAAVDGGP